MKTVARELQKLGLSDKEAMVYIASLELGPSPVQAIAQRASVNRATTYVLIESLTQRGLMSSFEKGKKTMYTAEKPERLHRIVHHERAAVDEKEQVVKRILPDLEALCDMAGERPKVSFYEGLDGLEAMREEFFQSRATAMDDLVSIDDIRHLLPEDHWKRHNKKLQERKIKGRVLFSSKSVYRPPAGSEEHWDYRKLPHDKFQLHGELTVFGDKVSMIALKGKLIGVIVHSKEMATMVKTLFELSWAHAKEFEN
jgi:predicted transcriptional regulator